MSKWLIEVKFKHAITPTSGRYPMILETTRLYELDDECEILARVLHMADRDGNLLTVPMVECATCEQALAALRGIGGHVVYVLGEDCELGRVFVAYDERGAVEIREILREVQVGRR